MLTIEQEEKLLLDNPEGKDYKISLVKVKVNNKSTIDGLAKRAVGNELFGIMQYPINDIDDFIIDCPCIYPDSNIAVSAMKKEEFKVIEEAEVYTFKSKTGIRYAYHNNHWEAHLKDLKCGDYTLYEYLEEKDKYIKDRFFLKIIENYPIWDFRSNTLNYYKKI